MFEILAESGAFLLFFVNIPQLRLTLKNRNNLKDLSITTQFLYLIVAFLYGVYGFVNGLPILWLYNIYGTFHFSATMYLVFRCRKKQETK